MDKQTRKPWGWYALAVGLVLCDQVVKHLVRAGMDIGEIRPFIPHLVELYYVENTGAAFSLLAGHTWLLALISTLVTGFLVAALWKGWLSGGWFSDLSLTLILAGAAGNLIDRTVRGAVTDMFNFTFMTFGIFNVADMCVVVGVIAFAVCLLRGSWEAPGKDGENDGADAGGE